MSTKDTRRGRPIAFDERTVLEAALHVFWRRGFAASLRELEEATGVDRSTIYNSFGGKRGLYERAAGHYVERLEAVLFALLVPGAGVGPFLDRLAAQIRDATTPAGCLIVRELATGAASPAATARYLEGLEAGLVAALRRPELAPLLAGAIVGINQVAVASQERALAMIEAVRELARS
ncbi:MAG: helix-turn-helix domain-containing protein [Myxococcota bacterium]